MIKVLEKQTALIGTKADQKELTKLSDLVDTMPRNQDLTFLYNKVLPQMHAHQETMDKYAADHIRFEAIIANADSGLDQKASKFQVRNIQADLEKNYTKSELIKDHQEKVEARLISGE